MVEFKLNSVFESALALNIFVSYFKQFDVELFLTLLGGNNGKRSKCKKRNKEET
jgi:hypothetical protein